MQAEARVAGKKHVFGWRKRDSDTGRFRYTIDNRGRKERCFFRCDLSAQCWQRLVETAADADRAVVTVNAQRDADVSALESDTERDESSDESPVHLLQNSVYRGDGRS